MRKCNTSPKKEGGWLFVAQLLPTTQEEDLVELFSPYGEVKRVSLRKDKSGKPYALVQLNDQEAISSILDGIHNQKDGSGKEHQLRVERAKTVTTPNVPSNLLPNRTLFLAKLDKSQTAEELRMMVEAYGQLVESVNIMKKGPNQSKGCAFVKYMTREDAEKAFDNLKKNQKKWVVEWANSIIVEDVPSPASPFSSPAPSPKATHESDSESFENTFERNMELGPENHLQIDSPSNDSAVDKCAVFLGGLNPLLVTKELIEARFSRYGALDNVSLVIRDHATNGFAFLRYSTPEDAASAIQNENGVEWLSRRIRVQYCESPEVKNHRRRAKYFRNQPSPLYPYPPHMYPNQYSPQQMDILPGSPQSVQMQFLQQQQQQMTPQQTDEYNPVQLSPQYYDGQFQQPFVPALQYPQYAPPVVYGNPYVYIPPDHLQYQQVQFPYLPQEDQVDNSVDEQAAELSEQNSDENEKKEEQFEPQEPNSSNSEPKEVTIGENPTAEG